MIVTAFTLIFILSNISYAGTHAPPAKDVKFIQSVNPEITEAHAIKIAKTVHSSSKKHKVKKELILSIMAAESTFKNKARSNGNYGLMQINYSAWKDDENFKKIVPNRKKLYDPDTNVEAGCFVLKYLSGKNKSVKTVIYSYLGRKDTSYYKKIMMYQDRYKRIS